jgi:uncharacterized protein YpuA (DUF1002 family)
MSASNVYLSLDLSQLFELAKQLSPGDKQQLITMLKEDQEYNIDIPEEHKNLVRERVIQYKKNPEDVLDWNEFRKSLDK